MPKLPKLRQVRQELLGHISSIEEMRRGSVGLLFRPVLQNKVVINLKFLKTHLPPPTLRSFPWLDRYDKENQK